MIRVKLPAASAVKFAEAALVKTGGSCTFRVSTWVASVPTPLLAFTVRVRVPAVPAPGVPEIAPVAVFRVRPLGRLPAVMLKVGAGKPAAARAKLPTVDSWKFAVLTLVNEGAKLTSWLSAVLVLVL